MNGLFEHDHRKSQEMQPSQGFWQTFIVPRQPTKTGRPGKAAFDHPAFGQQDETFLGLGQLDDDQLDAILSRLLSSRVAGVAFDKGDFDRITRHFLDLLGQFANLSAFLFIGRGNIQRQQMAQSIHGDMSFAALFAFMPIVAGPLTAFWGRLQRSAIENRRRRLFASTRGQAQQGPQIVDHRFEHASTNPTLGLLIDRVPRRQVVRHHPPGCPSADQPAQAIEHFAQLVVSLGRIFAHQGQVGGREGPFIISYVTWVCFSFHLVSIPALSSLKVHNTPYADVQPNRTVAGGSVIIPGSHVPLFGAGKVSWKADGSALAYGMRSGSRISQIPASPPYGSTGQPLPVVEYAAPNLVTWGPTEATKDLYLYFSKDNWMDEGVAGIYLNTVGNATGGAKLVEVDIPNGQMVYDIEWLPDASGFLFSGTSINLGTWTNIFRYEFGNPPTLTPVTALPDNQGARAFSISPDGQEVAFEWVPDIFLDKTSSLWITNSDGSGAPRWLANDAGRPAWGQAPPPLTPRAYLPIVVK